MCRDDAAPSSIDAPTRDEDDALCRREDDVARCDVAASSRRGGAASSVCQIFPIVDATPYATAPMMTTM
jgi:hypothetical protein